jgi:hypothetical protein
MIRSSFKAGDIPPSNDWYNRVLTEAKRTRLGSTGAGLELSGRTLSRRRSPRIWAKLTGGSGGAYGFEEVVPNTSGGFSLLIGGRTDGGGRQPAYEISGSRRPATGGSATAPAAARAPSAVSAISRAVSATRSRPS